VVFFNYTTMQVSAKIVYYGPGLGGKTTNLLHIHNRTDPGSRGEMVSLETEADRTLFFDLLPLEVGVIGGMRVKLQLYTVPGQVFYNTTRKLVLKGVDGIVFVADSQVAAMDGNIESIRNLEENLKELSQPLENIPFIIQYNKRDLRNIHTVDTLQRSLNPKGYETCEAAALHGLGVFETLKAISKKTLAGVHRRIAGVEESPEKLVVPAYPRAADSASSPGVETPAALSSPPVSVAVPPSSPTTDEAVDRTRELKVEFAADPGTTLPPSTKGRRRPARRIATKSRLDIERELEKLREIAWGDKPKATTEKIETAGDEAELLCRLRHQARVKLPREVYEKAGSLILDIRLYGDDSFHEVPDVVQVELPSHRAGQKVRLLVTLDMEEE